MSAKDADKAFKALIKRLEKSAAAEIEFPPPLADADPVLHELICSMLVWEASQKDAAAALTRIQESVADYNELRICYPEEMTSLLGASYPRAVERADRMRHVLCDIFERQNALTADHLREAPKREARSYLESLEGMPMFVAARVMLLAVKGHAFPVDSRVLGLLTADGVVEADADEATASSQAERLVRAGDAEPAYLLIERSLTTARKSRKAPTRTTRKRTTKKTTAKKSKPSSRKSSGG